MIRSRIGRTYFRYAAIGPEMSRSTCETRGLQLSSQRIDQLSVTFLDRCRIHAGMTDEIAGSVGTRVAMPTDALDQAIVVERLPDDLRGLKLFTGFLGVG